MFQIAKQAFGAEGSFVKLVQLDSEDFAVVVRRPCDGRLFQKYIGPDFFTAEEVFTNESKKIAQSVTCG